MAANKFPWVRHLGGDNKPLIQLGRFQAGATQQIKRGELLELSGGNFVPLTTDKAMAATVAIAAEEVKDGDLAGDYEIYVPRPKDLWRFALSASGAPAKGSTVAVSDSQTVTSTVTNTLGLVVDHSGFPKKQNHLSDGGLIDKGTTTGNTLEVDISIKEGASYYNALFADDA